MRQRETLRMNDKRQRDKYSGAFKGKPATVLRKPFYDLKQCAKAQIAFEDCVEEYQECAQRCKLAPTCLEYQRGNLDHLTAATAL